MVSLVVGSTIENGWHISSKGSGKMKLIRVNEKMGSSFVNCINSVRTLCDLEGCFEVIADYGAININLQATETGKEFHNKLLERSKQYRDAVTSKSKGKLKLNYSDLEDLPCFLILIEKGRMGDTFPSSLDCMDLRSRHSNESVPPLSSFIQEIGRICRYIPENSDELPAYAIIGSQLYTKLKKSGNYASQPAVIPLKFDN
jgi:hypothetical protein